MSDARDPFVQDQKRRERLMDEVYSVRLALFEAHEAQDGAAALDALRRAYLLMEQLDEGRIVYVGSLEEGESFAPLPRSARQLLANWSTPCSQCSERIRKGDMFYWVPDTKERICLRCGGVFFGMERQR